ncbi:MAG: YihY/virulence factor BrkB family protein, partial [Planctomycetota bacterium]
TRLWPRLKQTVKHFKQDDGNLLAAAMAYYATLSFFPLLLILISALGLLLRFSGGTQDAERELLALLAEKTSPVLSGHVVSVLAQIRASAAISGPLGLAVLLLAAIGVFRQFETALDRIWKVDRRRGTGIIAAVRHTLFRRLRAFLMLLGVGILVFAGFIGGMAASAVGRYATDLPGGGLAWNLIHTTGGVVLNWLLFTIIYKVLPKVRVRWSEASRGGLLAAVLWEAARQVLALLLLSKKYTAYRLVGSLIGLMLWIYIASSVLFLGAEYVRVIRDDRAEKGC